VVFMFFVEERDTAGVKGELFRGLKLLGGFLDDGSSRTYLAYTLNVWKKKEGKTLKIVVLGSSR
jgi:hypothetical protein